MQNNTTTKLTEVTMNNDIGYGILYTLQGLALLFVIYVGVWTPKEKMKGHAGRGKCKCCK
jgi:hypothetical protein